MKTRQVKHMTGSHNGGNQSHDKPGTCQWENFKIKDMAMKQNPKLGLFLLASYKCHNYTILGQKHPSSPMTIQIFFFF